MSDQATSHAIEATLAATGSKATYTGAGMTVGGWMLSSEFAVLFGMLIGLAGLGVQWHFRNEVDDAGPLIAVGLLYLFVVANNIKVIRKRNAINKVARLPITVMLTSPTT